jgi:hypothetical protein
VIAHDGPNIDAFELGPISEVFGAGDNAPVKGPSLCAEKAVRGFESRALSANTARRPVQLLIARARSDARGPRDEPVRYSSISVMPSAIAARSDDQAIIIERQGVAPTMISERVFEKTSCRPAWVVFRFNDLYLDFETA